MMIAYKALEPDLSCTSGGNRYQYAEHIWNEEPEADCARRGFHCAANPLDCLTYYPDWSKAVYYMVLADGDVDEDAYDSKISCTKLKLVKRLEMSEFIAHSLRYLADHPFMKDNSNVSLEKGTAVRGFALVRGKNPAAKGKIGDVLGIAKERVDSREIEAIGIHIIDGESLMADTWYDVSGQERSVIKE